MPFSSVLPSAPASALPSLSSLSPLADALSAALPSREVFERALAQTARLITLTTPLPDAALVAERFQGEEALSRCYQFEVDCLSSSAHLELKQFIGEELSLRVLLADGRSTRSWHGLVSRAAQLGADGGLARYRLTLSPWLALLAHRRTSRVFQDKTVQEIVSEVFAHYPMARFSFALQAPLALRSLCCQYRESDLDFVQRLLASEGLSYRFVHDQADTPEAQTQQARHALLIFDADTPLPQSTQAEIRFHRSDATEGSDTLDQWQSRQSVLANAVTRGSWDYRQLIAPAGSAEVDAAPWGGLGAVPVLEDYQGSGAYRYMDAADAEQAAVFRARYQALAMGVQAVAGSVRQLAPGEFFTVLAHPVLRGEAAKQVVLSVLHEARNNLESSATRVEGLARNASDAGTYRCQAVCVPASLPLAPRPIPKPAVPGLQTAIVVGAAPDPAATGTHSERDGRVKIQFPWQRGRRPLAGSPSSETERATGDETNGTWVRVAEWLAGPNWGSSFTPRVGSEVLVDFIEADIDRPVVVAALYNGEDSPPWPAGEGSSANHPGVLAGLHAPTLDGSGWSQWQLDDATGQLRTSLRTSFASSQLNLGYLIHQSPTRSERGAYRGQGFELATDGWNVTRAAQGMLLSTTARQRATSTQLDTTEVAAQLKAASDTASRLSDAASQSEADPLAQAKQIEAFRQTVFPEEAKKDGTDQPDRALKSFTSPAIAIEAPASIAFATPQSSTLFASEQLSATVQADTQLSAQHSASFVSGEATSFYTHAGGIKAIAANSPLSIQAHDGPLEVLADQSVTVTSSNDEIQVLASSKIVLQAGQSSITLEGGNITFACPGKFTVKGSQHVMGGGAAKAAELEILPSGAMGKTQTDPLADQKYDQFFVLRWANSGKPVKNRRFKIRRKSGAIQTGTTNAEGRSTLLDTATTEERLSVEVLREDLA